MTSPDPVELEGVFAQNERLSMELHAALAEVAEAEARLTVARNTITRQSAQLDPLRADLARATAVVRKCEAVLVAVRTDRPTVHSDRVWAEIDTVIRSARASLASITTRGEEAT